MPTTDEQRATQRRYQKQYRTDNKKLEIVLSQAQYQKLKAAAHKHKMKVASFARRAIFSKLEETYIVPDEETIHELQQAIRRVGNNVNQLAKAAHQRGINPDDIKACYRLLEELERDVSTTLRNPKQAEEG